MSDYGMKPMDGQTFGNLKVLRRDGAIRGYAAWLCECTCGQKVRVRSDNLRLGRKKSCCINKHKFFTPRDPGLTRLHPSEFQSFRNMHERCRRKAHSHYKHYGRRGIRVTKRWETFAQFFADMGPKPTPQHTIDRRDNGKGYEPGNCRWATRLEQRRNMRTSVYVVHEGERQLLMDVVLKFGVSRNIAYQRLKLGWSLEDALTIPVRPKKVVQATTLPLPARGD